jgi:hypothetical protein
VDLKEMTEEQLDAAFNETQAVIGNAQAAQTAIDKERRRRRAATMIEAKRRELAALEADLGEPA